MDNTSITSFHQCRVVWASTETLGQYDQFDETIWLDLTSGFVRVINKTEKFLDLKGTNILDVFFQFKFLLYISFVYNNKKTIPENFSFFLSRTPYLFYNKYLVNYLYLMLYYAFPIPKSSSFKISSFEKLLKFFDVICERNMEQLFSTRLLDRFYL